MENKRRGAHSSFPFFGLYKCSICSKRTVAIALVHLPQWLHYALDEFIQESADLNYVSDSGDSLLELRSNQTL